MHLKGYIVLLCIVMIICGCDAARKGRKRQRSRQKDAEHRKVTPTSTNVNSNVTHLQTTVPTSRTTLKPSSTTIQTTPGRTREQIRKQLCYCPPGEGVRTPCNETSSTKARCKRCPKNYYSSKRDDKPCRPCTPKCPVGYLQLKKVKCTKVSNIVCAKADRIDKMFWKVTGRPDFINETTPASTLKTIPLTATGAGALIMITKEDEMNENVQNIETAEKNHSDLGWQIAVTCGVITVLVISVVAVVYRNKFRKQKQINTPSDDYIPVKTTMSGSPQNPQLFKTKNIKRNKDVLDPLDNSLHNSKEMLIQKQISHNRNSVPGDIINGCFHKDHVQLTVKQDDDKIKYKVVRKAGSMSDLKDGEFLDFGGLSGFSTLPTDLRKTSTKRELHGLEKKHALARLGDEQTVIDHVVISVVPRDPLAVPKIPPPNTQKKSNHRMMNMAEKSHTGDRSNCVQSPSKMTADNNLCAPKNTNHWNNSSALTFDGYDPQVNGMESNGSFSVKKEYSFGNLNVWEKHGSNQETAFQSVEEILEDGIGMSHGIKGYIVTANGGCIRSEHSEVELHISRGSIPSGSNYFVKKSTHVSLAQFTKCNGIDFDVEAFASPVSEFNESQGRQFLKHVMIKMPHSALPSELDSLRVWYSESPSEPYQFKEIHQQSKENNIKQDVYYVVDNNFVKIFTKHFTKYVCTKCKTTTWDNLLAMVFGSCSNSKEMRMQVYLCNALYAIKDFKTQLQLEERKKNRHLLEEKQFQRPDGITDDISMKLELEPLVCDETSLEWEPRIFPLEKVVTPNDIVCCCMKVDNFPPPLAAEYVLHPARQEAPTDLSALDIKTFKAKLNVVALACTPPKPKKGKKETTAKGYGCSQKEQLTMIYISLELSTWLPQQEETFLKTNKGEDDMEKAFDLITNDLPRDKVKPLARNLGLTDTDIEDLHYKFPNDLKEMIWQMLRLWKQRNGCDKIKLQNALDRVSQRDLKLKIEGNKIIPTMPSCQLQNKLQTVNNPNLLQAKRETIV